MTAAGDLIAERYRVGRPLVAGRLGHIWLGTDERSGREVVLKRSDLPDTLTPRERDVVRVWMPREARAFARIRHPNVIRTLDVLLDGDASWIVMEYVPSRSLLDVVREDGALPPGRVAEIGLDLLAALTAAWEADVLHLDVKPSNVLIADDGRVVLTDFGPAGTRAGVAAMAEAGIIFGTPHYVAPERLFGGASDERSDLWSLGATLYHLVEGRPPYHQPAAGEDGPDPPYLAGPLTPVLLGLLRRNPAERMTAAQVRSRLRRTAPSARRATALRAAAAVAVAAAVVAVGGSAFDAERGVPSSAAAPSPAASPSASLPSGYGWWTDPGAFRVAAPNGWRPTRTDDGLTLTAPGGRPTLTVMRWNATGPLVPALVTAEQQARLPGYRRIHIVPATDPPGAVWEYTFQDPVTGPMRALRQIVTLGDRSYQLDWRAPAAGWASALPTLLTVLATLGPDPAD
ncbi:hypothetical protein Ade02nite_08760 [Paractinoplanes deccanensis]|uniref:non-specific serine/threonine protein kinase n=1 Tax=Paractinoplanes deccanensis TaxID=113561 RepID=A0ABQ3XWW1_9ACTN|nr:serine/threonine-protein kinase [Actinoplanes deccanensis]GID72235.1 hypothetical protein Ade02nite_08760 [Actinoplanes deccanensis]